MTKRVLVFAALLFVSVSAFAQTPAPDTAFAPVQILIGDWIGEGEGGQGTFSFHFDLQNTVIVRRNHTEYPAKGTQPATVHDDLLVLYKEGAELRATYWDNEKHVIRYAVNPTANGVEFISDAINGAPRFRLTYRKIADDKLEIAFDIAPPGKDFNPYLKGIAHRAK